MARAALKRGLTTSRSAITRRPWAPSRAHPDDVHRQGDEIAAANEQLAPFRVLRGIECDVLADGRLDLADDIPAGLAGTGKRARRAADAAAGADQARRGGAAKPVRAVPEPSQGPVHQPAGGERPRPGARVFRLRGRNASRSRSTASPSASTSVASPSATRCQPACRSSAQPTRARCAGSKT